MPHVRRHQATHTPVTPAGEDLAANPRAAICGTIVAGAFPFGKRRPLRSATRSAQSFWVCLVDPAPGAAERHEVHDQTHDHGLRHGRSDLKVLGSIMVQELSMLVAPALSILFLLLGALGVLEEALAVRLALWNGVVQLVGWGIDVGRRRGQSWPAALLKGLVNGAFGVVIVLLEVQLH